MKKLLKPTVHYMLSTVSDQLVNVVEHLKAKEPDILQPNADVATCLLDV